MVGPGMYEVAAQNRAVSADTSAHAPFMSAQEGRDGWQRSYDAPYSAPFRSQVPGPGYYQNRKGNTETKGRTVSVMDCKYK